MEKIINGNIYYKRFYYFNIYVIRGDNGDILIDTGFIFMKRRIRRWLKKFNIKLIILTHAHVDHIWNASYLKNIYNAKIAMGKDDIANLDNSIINAKAMDKKYEWWTKLMNFGMKKLKPNKFDVDIILNDQDIIKKYGLKLKIINLSGHTNGSIGILYKDYLFVGDALVNRKLKIAEVAYQNQDNEKAKESALKIKEIKPKMIFIGHDNPITYDKLIKSIEYLQNKNF